MATVLRRGFKVIYGVLTAPPHIRQIFHEAYENLKARAAELDATQPGWRDLKGPSALPAFSVFVNEVARNRGHVDEVALWVRKLFKDDELAASPEEKDEEP